MDESSNFGKDDEKIIQKGILDIFSCDERFPKKLVGCNDTNQGEYNNSYVLQGNNTIFYISINLKYYDVACSSQMDVVMGLPSLEVPKSFLGGTLGVYDDHFTYKCSSLLKHMYGIIENFQVSNGVDRIDHDNRHDFLNILGGESFAISFVNKDHVNENFINNGIYILEERLFGCNSLPLNNSPLLKKNILCECEDDTLVEGKSRHNLCPWLVLPFYPSALLGFERNSLGLCSISLDVYPCQLLCYVCTELFMIKTKDSWLYFNCVNHLDILIVFVSLTLTLMP